MDADRKRLTQCQPFTRWVKCPKRNASPSIVVHLWFPSPQMAPRVSPKRNKDYAISLPHYGVFDLLAKDTVQLSTYTYNGPIVWPNGFSGGSSQVLLLRLGLTSVEARDINAG